MSGPPQQYKQFKKIPDLTSVYGFDVVGNISALATPVVGPNADMIPAHAVYIVDPGAAGNAPLKPATLGAVSFAANATNSGNSTLLGVFTGRLGYNQGLTNSAQGAVPNYQFLEDWQHAGVLITSATATAQTLVIDTRNLAQILAIDMVTSAGTATLVVSASVNSASYLQVDSIAAAAQTDLQYTLATNALNGAAQASTVAGTGASTVKLNPLAFRYVKVVAGSAGVGNTTTTTIAMK